MIEPQTLYLEEDVIVPNNPVLPVLIYPKVLDKEVPDRAGAFEERFAENGWRGIWRNGILGYHHFHPDAHEALGIARGTVEVQLGRESGKRFEFEAGDMLVLPAGTGHKKLPSSTDLLVIGAYPQGQEKYTTRRDKIERDLLAQVSRPDSDPFYGKEGPLTRAW